MEYGVGAKCLIQMLPNLHILMPMHGVNTEDPPSQSKMR
jgi:hypothetical protein